MSTKVEPGIQFRSVIQDRNALWEVKYKAAFDIWVCEVVPEFDFDELIGHTQPFNQDRIEQILGFSDAWDKLTQSSDDWWAAQEPGMVVHYSNFLSRQWVRGVVTADHQMLPTALLGEWQRWELPQLSITGPTEGGYHAKLIANADVMRPAASNMYEYNPSKFDVNPSDLAPLVMTVPDPTPEQQKLMDRYAVAQRMCDVVEEQMRDFVEQFREVSNA